MRRSAFLKKRAVRVRRQNKANDLFYQMNMNKPWIFVGFKAKKAGRKGKDPAVESEKPSSCNYVQEVVFLNYWHKKLPFCVKREKNAAKSIEMVCFAMKSDAF